MYEMVEKANQDLKVRYKSQQACTSSWRFPHYKSGAPRNRPQKSEWRDERNDHSRQDSRQQVNDKCIPRDSSSRNSESAIRGNEQNLKQCRYCKNIEHEIEKCRKRQCNNSQNNSGNSRNLSRPADGPRAGSSKSEYNWDSEDRTRGKECRVAVTKDLKSFQPPYHYYFHRRVNPRTRFHARYERQTQSY